MAVTHRKARLIGLGIAAFVVLLAGIIGWARGSSSPNWYNNGEAYPAAFAKAAGAAASEALIPGTGRLWCQSQLGDFAGGRDEDNFGVKLNSTSDPYTVAGTQWINGCAAGFLLIRGGAHHSPPVAVNSAPQHHGKWAYFDTDANDGLLSVSCPTPTFCAASDSRGNVSLFNGTSWSNPVSVDSAGAYLNSISCATGSGSQFCAAVDSQGQVVTYNGRSWTQPAKIDPSGEGLLRVSCATTSFCVAVDPDGSAFTYDGRDWHEQSIDGSGGKLWAVACPSSSFCAAFDLDGNTLHSRGASWTAPIQVDTSGSLQGGTITCASDSFCMTSDSLGYMTAFTGGRWSPPVTVDQSRLTSVSCASSTFCMAVDIAGNELTYNGKSWSRPTALTPQGELWSVSCRTASFCAVVGQEGIFTYR